ncbi:MAG TPA: amino acid permease [Elusimicrobiota bacterium]|nr:amino acid permease [Elusimicrobiota bacterium]
MTDSLPSAPRRLGLWDASALVVGCIIGAGIFRLSDSVARASPSVFLFLAAWVLGGLLSLCGALVWAELATRFPRNGGEYVFLSNGYGRAWGFVYGWTRLFVSRTGTLAILAFVFAEHAARVFGAGPGAVKPVATAAVLGLTALNILGVRFGKSVQNLFTVLKLLALFGIIAVGLLAGGGSPVHLTPFWPAEHTSILSSLGLALIPVLWTYGGWYEAAYVAGEVRDPNINLPRAIVGGLLATTGIYLLINLVYVLYLPLDEMRVTDLVAAGVMDKIWPRGGGSIVAAMVMVSTFGALNGFIFSSGRLLSALGQDHALFKKMGVVSARTQTPAAALAANAVLALVLVWTGTLDKIVTYTEVVIYLFFAATGVSLFVFRRREGAAPGGYRVWGYPWTPLAFILLNVAIALNGVAEEPAVALAGIGVAALGFPLYWASRRLGPKT